MLNCVNPYDVNPMNIVGINNNNNNNEKNIKLEMEEFSDLEPYLPEDAQKMAAASTLIDELNTPTFDRKGFDFTVYENTTYVQSPSTTTTTTNTNTTTTKPADDPFKFEYELLRMDSVQTNNSNDSITYSNDSNNNINEMNIQIQSNFINNHNNNNTMQDSEANLLFSTTTTTTNEANQQENIYIINGNETPMHVHFIDNNLNNNNNNNKNNDNNNEYIVNITKIKSESNMPSSSPPPSNLGFETPEDSNSCPGSAELISPSSLSSYINNNSNSKIPNLKLNFNFTNQPPILNTPDVIDSVVDLEHSFNILDYVDDKDVSTVNFQDIELETPTTSTTIVQNQRKPKIEIEPPLPTTTTIAKNYRFRKRRLKPDTEDDDDSDEDYVPPPTISRSKRFKYTPKRKIKCEESDSDSDDTGISSISNNTINNTTINNNNRLKITKRTSSVCSDYSDASKYRELRDKNNEASRRSRFKRKMKELSLETEAEQLNERNIKLKAQVEELEKMVNNFRNNLFKIMLKK